MDSILTSISRPSSPLSFGLPPIPPNVNRNQTSFKIKERESIRFLCRENRNTVKRFIAQEMVAERRQRFIIAYTGTLLKNLYYLGNSYLIQSFKPDEKYAIIESCMRKKNAIIHNTILLEKLICQTRKILETGVTSQQHFISSIQHLETERVFIISKIRKEALVNLLKLASATNGENSYKGTKDLTINSIDCKARRSEKCCAPTWKYYFFVLHHETTIYGTIFTPADSEGNLVFKGPFIFQNILGGSIIKFKLYTLELDFDFFMCPPERFVLPLMRLSAEFTIDLPNVSLKECCIRPVNDSKSSDINEFFERLTIRCVKTDKTSDRSMA